MNPAILFSQMEPPAELTGEFHRWYETDHIPARMVLPGFLGARRYHALDGDPAYLAVYELDDLDALATEGYQQLKAAPSALTDRMLSLVNGFTRFTCEQISDVGQPVYGPYLSVVAFAMFHRLRLWVTEAELDNDLTGLGLQPVRAADGFRTPAISSIVGPQSILSVIAETVSLPVPSPSP